ncbi:predicted protein [Naegleria gruberi]|uniref:Predicted protein n=1 Tax=Naegleria gruberi TaxID=5762 RepID=D2UXM6_NAEGR|nr:uncharacterized protein NAEGRDRAFT_61180 [Naegleria gruberi]EFC50310.1 predicted protein [Naegleria gruberi]|eukprot:XP_002683054.1 predicted protein [Naegleria gruberi strain NEG-M]
MSNDEINIEVEGFDGSVGGSSEQIEKRKEIIDESDEDEVDDPLKPEMNEDSLITLENIYEDRMVFDPYDNIHENGKLNFATKNNKNYLKIFSITWNMMGLSSPNEEYLLSFIPTNNYHIYCFATQECERSIGTSVIIESKAKWEKTLNSIMGDSYIQLESCTLVAIHLIIFVRKELLTQISNVRTCSVPTGLYNQIGNKGGVSISFKLGKRKFVFINNHLPAHQENVKERNESVKRIIDSIDYEGKIQQQPSKTKVNPAVSQSNFTLFKRADRPDILKKNNFVFYMGDLNYRINGNRKVVDKVLKMNDLKVLQLNDQLILERKKGTVDLKHFSEGEIIFPPTYKFEKNSNQYDLSKKQRIPAWTDRILFKPSKKGKIHLVDYNFFPQVKYSDHRPVYALFLVDCPGVILETTSQEPNASTSQVCLVQ